MYHADRSFLHTCECRITYLCTCVLHFEDSSLLAVSRGPDISASHRHESNRFPYRRHSSVKDIPVKYVSETNYSMAFLVLHHYLHHGRRAECKYYMISINRSCDQAMRVHSPMTNVTSDGMILRFQEAVGRFSVVPSRIKYKQLLNTMP